MMFEWKPDMIRFMRDACEYGSYNRRLADIISPYITKESHVCDAGCGLGYLSLELAKLAGEVSSVDINENALAILRDNCQKHGIDNIRIQQGDVFSMPVEEKYSAVVFCYFGEIEQIIESARDICSGTLIIFKRNYELHRFSVGSFRKNERDGYEYFCSWLRERGVAFRTFEFECEFGQPFKSIEDARLFYELYSQDTNKRVITDLVMLDKLVPTGRDDFPLYMPYMKKTGCIIINTQDIPAE